MTSFKLSGFATALLVALTASQAAQAQDDLPVTRQSVDEMSASATGIMSLRGSGGGPSAGGVATLDLESGSNGVGLGVDCDTAGAVLGLLTLGATGGGRGCRNYNYASYSDFTFQASLGYDNGFIGNLRGGAAFYPFDTEKNPLAKGPILDLGFNAVDGNRMRTKYLSPEFGLRFGSDLPGAKKHLSLLGTVGGYTDNVNNHSGFFLLGGIARGELNVGKHWLLKGEVEGAALMAGHQDATTNSATSTVTNPDGSTTITITPLPGTPGWDQNGAGAYVGATCSVRFNANDTFFTEISLMKDWQKISTSPIDLHGNRGPAEDDSSDITSVGLKIGGHFR